MKFIMPIKILSRKFLLIISLCIGLAKGGDKSYSQKTITPKDYSLWSKVETEGLSPDGQWLYFRLTYEQGADSLYLIHTVKNKKHVFPRASKWEFINEQQFLYIKKDSLFQVNLGNGKTINYPKATSFGIPANNSYLVVHQGSTTKHLQIYKDSKLIDEILNVSTYLWEASRNQLVYHTETSQAQSVGLLDFSVDYVSKIILESKTEVFQSLTWSEEGKHFAFYGKEEQEVRLYHYNTEEAVLSRIDSQFEELPTDYLISTGNRRKMCLSNNGHYIFFPVVELQKKPKETFTDEAEVWHYKDRELYISRELRSKGYDAEYLAVWSPEQKTIRILHNSTMPWITLNGNQTYALTGNPHHYTPHYQATDIMDFYLVSTENGDTQLFLEKQPYGFSYITFSPNGRYICYFRENNWWIYDVESQKHSCLTNGINVDWNYSEDPGRDFKVWGQPGWSSDSHLLYLYDYHDIWEFNSETHTGKRLTKGKEEYSIYRFDSSSFVKKSDIHIIVANTAIIPQDIPLLLTVDDEKDGSRSIAVMSISKKIMPLTLKGIASTRIRKSKNAPAFIYTQEKFDIPPKIIYQKNIYEKSKTLFQSNPHYTNYISGTSEIITYTLPDGKIKNASLYLPAGYDSSKTYPMIVYIYEQFSKNVFEYINPTLRNSIGFNPTLLTQQGYVVLKPDFQYKAGEPGLSALRCVTAVVQEVIDMGIADSDRLGLMGHSFGGYETNFIITQTPIFAVAVSGAAVADVQQQYFSLHGDDLQIDAWRYESQQYRMKVSFFENTKGYLKNSPILHTSQITTPLLIWTGGSDKNVSPKQSLSYYIALRRLEKESIMLVYPDEGHIFRTPSSQIDLTMKLTQWLDYHLKDKKPLDWMLPHQKKY